MAAAQHKLSRRALLAGACVAPVVPLRRHCEERSDTAIQCGACADSTTGLVDLRSPSARSARNDASWAKALARFARAEAGLEAVAHTEDDNVYGHALGRQHRALAGLLRAPAPDLAAVARKLDLIVRHSAFELSLAEPCLDWLRQDVGRLAVTCLSRRAPAVSLDCAPRRRRSPRSPCRTAAPA